ncbi:PREDICTED: protein yippee-like 4 isoform X1 [Chinchilla lanigera]|uniref:protein yippee-like 4 isoform X1 n=1 Tax=Chinchilla lanigera TaxID=34839 RepID=UPI000699067C|nr:PREDICTED: protein yippee-like 4 isoform X1 [Chinchilla lanigera]
MLSQDQVLCDGCTGVRSFTLQEPPAHTAAVTQPEVRPADRLWPRSCPRSAAPAPRPRPPPPQPQEPSARSPAGAETASSRALAGALRSRPQGEGPALLQTGPPAVSPPRVPRPRPGTSIAHRLRPAPAPRPGCARSSVPLQAATPALISRQLWLRHRRHCALHGCCADPRTWPGSWRRRPLDP